MSVLPINSDATMARNSKFAGFDAVRAAAAFGVVLLHCCVPYMQPPVPGLAWSVRDTPHWLAEQCFWTIELFIMPLFLVLAGFLAWQTLQRSGADRLIRTRARRLLVPLLFGIVVILPLDLYAWLLGWVAEGLIAPQKLRSLKFNDGIDRDLWGLSHLWFLQYLFLYVLALAGGVWAWNRNPLTQHRVPRTTVLASLLLLVACLTLYFYPEVVWGFQHSFFPVPSKWIYSGSFFALGALLAARDAHLDWLKAHAGRLAAPSVVFAVAALALGSWHLQGGSNELASVTLAVTTCLSAVMITLTLIGVTVKHVQAIPLSVSYLAAASFWIYMIHHPILGLIHTDLKWMLPATNPLVKVALSFVATSALSIATYELWVRQSALGRLLGFEWQAPVRSAQATWFETTSSETTSSEHTDTDTERGVISIGTRHDTTHRPTSAPTRRAA